MRLRCEQGYFLSTPLQLLAKDRELTRLKEDYAAVKAQYEEMLKGHNREQVQDREKKIEWEK
jgi:hypothetical protein